MQRILVMGSSGSGKSTFARRLSMLTGLPTISLDALYWKPGWKPSKNDEFGKRVIEAVSRPSWIIDGNYISNGAGEMRRRTADTIIWFDLPRRTCLIGIMTRIARSYGRMRPEMAEGCPEKIDIEFFRYVWTYRAVQRPELLKYFEGIEARQRSFALRGVHKRTNIWQIWVRRQTLQEFTDAAIHQQASRPPQRRRDVRSRRRCREISAIRAALQGAQGTSAQPKS